MLRRFRPLSLAAGLVAGLLFAVAAGSAEARGPISYNNPYRSFNIGGVNYGSMQWERQNRSRSVRSTPYHRTGLFGRRR